MLNIWGNPLERCNDWVHYSVFSPHTVIVFSITKLTWQLLAGRYYQDANLIFTRCLDLKTCIKNDHDSLTDFQDSAIWMDFGRKTSPNDLDAHGSSWLENHRYANLKVLVAPGEWAKLFVDWVEPPRGWVKWAKTAESKGNMDLKETQKWWRWWRWICWRRGSGTHLLMEQNSTTICLYVYSRVTCLIYIYRYKMI